MVHSKSMFVPLRTFEMYCIRYKESNKFLPYQYDEKTLREPEADTPPALFPHPFAARTAITLWARGQRTTKDAIMVMRESGKFEFITIPVPSRNADDLYVYPVSCAINPFQLQDL